MEFWAARRTGFFFIKSGSTSPNFPDTRGPNPRSSTHKRAPSSSSSLLNPPTKKKEPSLPSPTRPSSSLRPPATRFSHGNGLQDGDSGYEHQGRVQELVHGDEVEEGAPVRGVQDRRAVARRAGGQGGRPRRRVRGAGRRAAQGRLPLRRLRLRLRLRRQLPEEQDLLHRLVTGGVEDKGQDSVRDVEAGAAAGAGRRPLRGAGHRRLRDGLRRHQRAGAMMSLFISFVHASKERASFYVMSIAAVPKNRTDAKLGAGVRCCCCC